MLSRTVKTVKPPKWFIKAFSGKNKPHNNKHFDLVGLATTPGLFLRQTGVEGRQKKLRCQKLLCLFDHLLPPLTSTLLFLTA